MKPEDEVLASLYLEQGMSLAGIGRLYGVHKNQVRRWLLRAAIPIRDISTATKLSGKFGVQSEEHREALRLGAAKARAKITLESRAKQAAAMKGRTPPNKGKPMPEAQRQALIAQRSGPEYRRRQSELRRGEKAWNWKGGVKPEESARLDRAEWRRLRREVYERDNWTCQDCGCRCLNTKDSKAHPKRKIQAHHVVSRRNGGLDTLDNLVTLCMSCHHKRERSSADCLFA